MPRMSSCARTDSASQSTLYVTMTLTAPMALMSPQNVVSVGFCFLEETFGTFKRNVTA